MRTLYLCILAVCIVSASAQARTELGSLILDLTKPETTEQAALKIISMDQSQIDVRSELSVELPKMLLLARDSNVVRTEAMLAGRLKLETAAPLLAHLLDQRNESGGGETITRRVELLDDPVGRALYEIGEPALPAMSWPLASKNAQTRTRAIRVLLLMKTPESRALLDEHLPRENDANLRSYLIANGIGGAH